MTVTIYDDNVPGLMAFPEGADAWALIDSNEQIIMSCEPFCQASKMGLAWIVQATSPLQLRYKGWKKHCHGFKYVMECFSSEEFISLGLSNLLVGCVFSPTFCNSKVLDLDENFSTRFPRNGALLHAPEFGA